jgi:hypothetical protein
MRLQGLQFVGSRANRNHHVLRPHLLRGLVAKDSRLGAGNFSVIQLQLNPLGHFRHRGIDGAGGSGIVQIFKGNDLQLAVNLLVRKRVIVTRLENGVAGIGGFHAQRQENLLAHVVIPAFAADRCHHLACGQKHQIVVGESGAEAGSRLQVAQAIDDFFARKCGVRPEHQVAFAQPEAAAVAQQVADLHFL